MDNTSRKLILQTLRDVLPSTPSIAVIHSSLTAIMPPSSFKRWDILFALDTLIREGWTIALPAFTFSFCSGKPFNLQSSPSEVGVLADWTLDALPGAIRSSHPIYSFALAGPAAAQIASLQPLTTFGGQSPFEVFEQNDATIVMFGCDWSYCTQFHRYEELAAVPYRYFKNFSGRAILGTSERAVSASMFVRDLKVNAENDFFPAVVIMRENGVITSRKLWRGSVESAPVTALAKIAKEQLEKDLLVYVREKPTIKYRIVKAAEAEKNPPFRIAALGHANLELFKASLESELRNLMPERQVEVLTVPFGQLSQQILDPNSDLARFNPQVSIFADRLDDLLGSSAIGEFDSAVLEERIEIFSDAMLRHCSTFTGPSIVFRYAPGASVVGTITSEMHMLFERLNQRLQQKLASLQPMWVDIGIEAAKCPASAFDARLWSIGRFPFSKTLTEQLARRCSGLILASIGKTARLVVVDLDNTLWGGVLGEDGIEGLQLGGDYPGNAFSEFQRSLKRLAGRGIALAISSKNDSDLALKVLDEHPDMELRRDDIVAHRINWQPKWTNIIEICEELSLGLESVLFVDDNPVEREAVRRNLPNVKILDLPEDPTLYASAISECPWLTVNSVTQEDIKRVKSYKARAKIEQERRTAVSLEDFYRSLDMTLGFHPLTPVNTARAVQLCQKTNQFNTTTRRYNKTDLSAIVDDGGDVVVLSLQDRLSDAENIGLIILKSHPTRENWGIIDGFLLSCRVLGRGLERAILGWALRRAKARGWAGLAGPIIETERNTPARMVFRDAGFLKDGPLSDWHMLSDTVPERPLYLAINDEMDTPARSQPLVLQ